MKFNSSEKLGNKIKPFGNQEEEIESLKNLTTKDFTPESFSRYFPLVIANSHAYKLWSEELANVINKSSVGLIDKSAKEGTIDNKESDVLEKKTQEYVEILSSCYKNGSFSEKVNVLNFINDNAFFPFLQKIGLPSFKDKIYLETKELCKKESMPEGNYFLCMYLSSFFEKREKNESKMDSFSEYKLASKDRYVYDDGNDILVSKPGQKEKIDSLTSTVYGLVDKNNWDEMESSEKEKVFNCLSQLESSFRKFNNEDISNINGGGDFDEKQEQKVMDYLVFLNERVQLVFNREFGVSLKELSSKEQFSLIGYFKDSTNKDIEAKKKFAQRFGVNGLRTFLSIEQGGSGDKILEIGNPKKLPEEISKKVFAKYREIIDKANNTEEEIKKIFGYENVPARVLSSVKETLLKRGAKMLSDLGDKVMDEKFVVNEKEILDELDEIKEETIILGESCAKLYREGIKVPIEDVTNIEEISVLKLTAEEKKELLKVYMNGRPKVTYENSDHLKMLEKEFEQELNNKDTSVFNIRFNGDIIIFAIVDKKDKDTLYIGGLTFVDEVRNPVVAEASMNLVLERFKNYNIKALVDSKNPILAMYQKRFGFNIVGELPKEENAGELYYEIERPKEKEGRKIEEENELEKAA